MFMVGSETTERREEFGCSGLLCEGVKEVLDCCVIDQTEVQKFIGGSRPEWIGGP